MPEYNAAPDLDPAIIEWKKKKDEEKRKRREQPRIYPPGQDPHEMPENDPDKDPNKKPTNTPDRGVLHIDLDGQTTKE